MPIRDEQTKKLRAKAMIQARVDGLSIAEVAQKFDVCTKTVERTLSWARTADLYIELEDKLMGELMPLAHNSLKRALEEETDGAVALELYKGKNLLKKQHTKSQAEVVQENDLAEYIRGMRDYAGEIDNTADGHVIDGTGEPKALPPAIKESVSTNSDGKSTRDEKS